MEFYKINCCRRKIPLDIPALKLLKYAVDFFHQDPSTQHKLKPGKKAREGKREEHYKAKRSPSRSMSQEREKSLTKKFAKYDNLRPLSNFILSALDSYEVPHFKTKKIVGEIIDRIVRIVFIG